MMKKFIEKLCDGVVKEWGMIVALVLLAMPPMLFAPVFFGGLHSGFVNGFDAELWQQLKYPIIDMGLLMLLVLVVVEIVHWIGKKWVKWIVYGVAVALATVRIWLWWVFRLRISPLTLTLLLETNNQESSEFVQVYLLGWYGVGLVGIVVGLVGLCLVVEKLDKYVSLKRACCRLIIGISFFVFLWGLIETRWLLRLLKCETSEEVIAWQKIVDFNDNMIFASNPQALLFSFVKTKTAINEMFLCSRMVEEIQKRTNELCCNEDSLLVVFTLGESYIKSHCALYEYEKSTSPMLCVEKEKGNLYVFYDVVTPSTSTSRTVKMVFFTNNELEKWYASAFFPQLFKMAGFEVDFWDSQRHFCANRAFTINMNSALYGGNVKKMSYSNLSDIGVVYDGELIDNYIENLFDLNRNRLIMFHLYGQHVDAADRFPHTKDNMIFEGTDDKNEKIAMYDNACVYNDKVVAEIIDMVRDKKSVVVYFSDHGEEVYDYRDCYGRKAAEPGMEKEFLKYQAEVPFMIWCSDKYKEAYPEIIEDIKASVDKPFITDNVCQVMFHLAGLKSPWYKEERDLLSDKYKCGKRIVNGMYDYDEIMGRK